MAFTHWNGQPHMIKVDFQKVPYKQVAYLEGYPNTKTGTYSIWGNLEIKEDVVEDGLLMITGTMYTEFEEIPPLVKVGYVTNKTTNEKSLRQTLYVPIYDVEEYKRVLGIDIDIPKLNYQTGVYAKIRSMPTRVGAAAR